MKKCPFCGGDAGIFVKHLGDGKTVYRGMCEKCGAVGAALLYDEDVDGTDLPDELNESYFTAHAAKLWDEEPKSPRLFPYVALTKPFRDVWYIENSRDPKEADALAAAAIRYAMTGEKPEEGSGCLDIFDRLEVYKDVYGEGGDAKQ